MPGRSFTVPTRFPDLTSCLNNPGLNGLVSPGPPGNNFQYHGKVMVWSAGPDGKIDFVKPANQGVNKDNVLSWQ